MRNLAVTFFIFLSVISCKTKKTTLTKTITEQTSKEKKSIASELQKQLEEHGLKKAKLWFLQNKNSNLFNLDIKEMAEISYSLFASEKINEAIEVLKLNVETFPNSKEVFDETIITNVAEQIQDQGKNKESLSLLELNIKINPNSERAHRAFGDYYLQQKNNQLAVEYYKKAATLNPRDNLFQIAFKGSNTYKPTQIPEDTTSLFVTRGDLNKSTVFLFVQGGPDLELNIHDQDPLHIIPKDILKVYPLQAAMLNPDMVVSIPTITKEQATYENSVSAEILYRTVNYFKNQDKTVYVIGHSHGGAISLNYINTKEVLADKIVLMGRDLDEDPRSHPKLGMGEFIRWEDGERPYVTNFFRGIPENFPVKDKLDAVISNLEMLVKTHSEKKYTNLLRDKSISNVIFVHARFDEANGRVTQSNLDFLKSKNATTIETFGNHHSMLSNEFMEGLYYHLTENTTLKKSVAATLSNIIENSGILTGINLLDSLRNRELYHPINEQEMNMLGYYLIKNKKINEAIGVFKINAQEFPHSWNVYDSLGEAYMTKGKNELAIKNYKKSLELNPENNYAIEALNKLKE